MGHEKAAIAARIKEGLRGRKGSNQHVQKGASGKISGPSDKGDTRDLAAAAVGLSGKTLEKAGKVATAEAKKAENGVKGMASRYGKSDPNTIKSLDSVSPEPALPTAVEALQAVGCLRGSRGRAREDIRRSLFATSTCRKQTTPGFQGRDLEERGRAGPQESDLWDERG